MSEFQIEEDREFQELIDTWPRIRELRTIYIGNAFVIASSINHWEAERALTSAVEAEQMYEEMKLHRERVHAEAAEDKRRHASAGRGVILTAASEVRPRRVYWLWEPRVPRGALTLLAGMPGVGKSLVSLDMAAQVTRGETTMQAGTPRCVLIYATEDAKAHVIVPRLIAAGANLDYVHFVEVAERDARGVESGSTLVLPIDQDLLADAITLTSALLVVFDPLMSVTNPKKSANQDRELRESLEPLAAVLENTGCTGIGLAHFRKAGGSTVDRIMGGRAFVGVARSVLVAVADQDAGENVLSLEKSNYGGLGTPGLRYRVRTVPVKVDGDDGVTDDQETPCVEWLGETDSDGADHVREILEGNPETKSAAQDAAAWLLMYLRRHGGSAWSEDVRDEAERVGISKSATHRGRSKAGVVVRRTEEFRARTFWCLPGHEAVPATTDGEGS